MEERIIRVLDGPIGTELIARGYKAHPQLWTARAALEAPGLLKSIHREYLEAGADILTAGTFRSSVYAAFKAGLSEAEARSLVHSSVAAVTEVVEDAGSVGAVMIAGSLGPLEDCYRPERTPADDKVIFASHRLTSHWLAETGCDLVILETMGTAREAVLAAQAAQAAGLRQVYVSFIVREDGAALLGGESLASAAKAAVEAGCGAVLVNCAHADAVERALAVLKDVGVASGAYANAGRVSFGAGGEPSWQNDSRPVEEQAREYAARAADWVSRYGITLVGGCCGMTPLHVRQLARTLKTS